MLVGNYKDKYFIKSQSVFFDTNSKYNLTCDEFYIYSFLYTKRGMDDHIETNLHLLNDTCPYRFVKTDRNNINRIRLSIQGLIDKCVLVSNNDLGDIKSNTTLQLSVNRVFSNGSSKEKSHGRIPYTKLLELSPQELFIYAASMRFPNGTNISYSDWGDLLGCTERHAITVINDAVKRGVVQKDEGRYYTEAMQEVNTYRGNPTGLVVDKKNGDDVDFGNWYNWKAFIEEGDVDVYLENIDNKELTKQVNKRMSVLRKNNKKMYDKFMGEINSFKESRTDDKAKEMLNEDKDLVLLVNGGLHYASDWSGDGKVDKCYYKINEYGDSPFEGVYVKEVERTNPTKEDIEKYRPINGEWRYDRSVIGRGVDYKESLLLPEEEDVSLGDSEHFGVFGM